MIVVNCLLVGMIITYHIMLVGMIIMLIGMIDRLLIMMMLWLFLVFCTSRHWFE